MAANVQRSPGLVPGFFMCAALAACADDSNVGSDFLHANAGGDPQTLQHLFWIVGHPDAWVFVFKIVLAFVAIGLLTGRLMRRNKWVWLAVLVASVGLVVTGLAMAVLFIHHAYTVGAIPEPRFVLLARLAGLALNLAALSMVVLGIRQFIRWLRAPIS